MIKALSNGARLGSRFCELPERESLGVRCAQPQPPVVEWHEGILVGLTQIGRATVELLVINHPDYVLLRETLIDEGVFPPQN